MSVVLDASIVMASLFEEPNHQAARVIIVDAIDEGLVAPSLWRLEIANALTMAARRKRCDAAFVDRSLERLDAMSIAIDVETDLHAWTETLDLARHEGLTLYDAAYLELAIRTGSSLASFDQDLVDAARRRGVAVLTA
ncbi:type II toxin-antitoxin system VapC family toxin [Caulobacter sp. BE254]|uniref:type II toxin-antitoxin system VapC family toxin n=1 Tax=Caulobacter sp. BE254 TaxID=2817720 RepID=UPI00285719C0|nr:type II toxin-antitoxin system VapC family toxin [Caulobacter sp. BE254]MDR7115255.1 putative nucleic acid-binding protein [Caulobacter sp. BE254]